MNTKWQRVAQSGKEVAQKSTRKSLHLTPTLLLKGRFFKKRAKGELKA